MTAPDSTSAWDEVFIAAATRFRSRPVSEIRTAGSGVDHRQLQHWARQAAEELRSLAQLGPTAGGEKVPVAIMAAALGQRVTYRRQTFDGHLSPDNGGEIRIRVGTSSKRARFTIAHELGHLWIYQHAPRSHPSHGLSHAATERLCDAIAANLLVSDAHLSQLPRSPNLHALRQLAESAGVSNQVVVNQATRRWRWRCLLLDWTLQGDQWCVHSSAGGPWDGREWTMALEAISTPIRSQRCHLDLETPTGPRRMAAQIGSWSRTRLTTLLTPVGMPRAN
ncbi:ImmA/IrrE family metallo-endopeptidase [Nocardioides ultimimeridianus]